MMLAQLSQPATPSAPLELTDVVGPYMGVFFAAFFAALVATPVMRLLATRNGIVDWPDLKRKSHIQPVAYLGGVAIFIGWLAGVALSYFTPPHDAGLGEFQMSFVGFPVVIILGAGAITLTGLFDDVYGISPRVKVSGQLFAAAALAWDRIGLDLAETSLALLGLHPPGWLVYLLGTLLLAVFVIGGCNSLNLLDGLDGLAAGVAAIACVGFLFIAGIVVVQVGSGELGQVADSQLSAVQVVMALAVLGAILGFLPYNFNPATIFMGDAGSLLLGYLCVTSMLLFAAVPGVGPKLVTAALIVFALPITDTSLAIFRRTVRGQPIFSPDNGHLHHLLRRAGLSVRQSVVLLYGVAVLFAVLGCSLAALELRWRYVLAVFVVLYGFIVVTAYKYGQRRLIVERMHRQADGDAEEPADLASLAELADSADAPAARSEQAGQLPAGRSTS